MIRNGGELESRSPGSILLERGRAIAAALLLFLAAPAAAQIPDSAVPQPPTISAAPDPGTPVLLGQDTVFRLRSGVGAFDAAERAAAVGQRLRDLSRDPYLRLDSVEVRAGVSATSVVVGDRVIVAVTEADAEAAGISRDSLARIYALRIQEVLQEQGFMTRVRIIAVGVLFALLAAAATILVFRLVNRFFPRLVALVERGRETWIPTVRIQEFELLTANQLASGVLAVLRALRIVLLAGMLYVSVPVILSFFPWTRRYADELFGYILRPFAVIWVGILAALPDVFALGAIAVTTFYLLRLIRSVFVAVARGSIQFSGFYPDWAIPTYKLVRTLVLIFAAIASWPYIPGSGTAAFQGVGIFVGLLVSIGSATAVGNMVGGVVLTYMRPFRVGDRVRIADTEGDVVEKTLLITRVRTPKNVDITIPNSLVLGSHIVNYSASAKSHGLILNAEVSIGYDVPWRQVEELLTAAARSVPDILAEPAPFVLQKGLSDYYPVYELNAYTREPNRMAPLYSQLYSAIQDRFHEAGVEIMSPAYHALRDGNTSTIPSPHAPPAEETPAFRVSARETRDAGRHDA